MYIPTLVGVATGTPDGGVAIVRLSGERAVRIVEEMTKQALPASRRLGRRKIPLGESHEDGLVVLMAGPNSFTGEDVVEVHIHGGNENVRQVVERCLDLGAIAAGRGDFSRRAFENGRLSLDQAEGVAAIIGARSEAALTQARRLSAGELGREVSLLREKGYELRCEIEAHLDFPDDLAEYPTEPWRDEVSEIMETLVGWERRFEAGRRSRERARVVIAGPPNAGKSALFNAMLQLDRALVAEVAGTTRDYVESELSLGPYLVLLVDTAGLRESLDEIEKAGIERSHDQVRGADIVLWCEAADSGRVDDRPSLTHVTSLLVETKRDCGRSRDWFGVSAETGENVAELRGQVEAFLQRDMDSAWIGLARHRDSVRSAIEALRDAKSGIEKGIELELIAFHLSSVERCLSEISGMSRLGPIGENVLHTIFERFCIGK